LTDYSREWEKKTERWEIKVEPSLHRETFELAGGPRRTADYVRQAVREKNAREKEARKKPRRPRP